MLALIVALIVIEFLNPAILFEFLHEVFAFFQQLIEIRQQFIAFLPQLQDRIVGDLDELLDIVLLILV